LEIHKPKAAHNWREFLIEIGTIICGILIALGLEQAIEWLHWRHQAEVAREAVAFDLRRTIGQAAMKDAESPCVASRLSELAEILDQAQVSKRLPPLGQGGSPQTPSWNLRSWTALTSGQTLAHIGNREQLLVSGVALYLDRLRETNTAEGQEWAALAMMQGPGRPTSDAEIASLRAALGRAYRDAQFAKVGSHQVSALVVQTRYLSAAQIDASFREGLGQAKDSAVCQLRQPPPAHTGELFHAGYLDRPVQRPEQSRYPGTVGVGGALTTDR
jgi:hypothetical protein